MTNFGEYSIKNLKTFMGMDDYGYNCTLYRGNKKVALCIYDGGGGQVEIQWYDHDDMVDYTYPNESNEGKPYTQKMTRNERDYNQFLSTLPRTYFDEQLCPNGLEMDDDLFIGDLVAQAQREKDYNKDNKKWHIVKTNDCKKGEYVRVPRTKSGYTFPIEMVVEHLDTQFGQGNYQIIETFDQFREQIIGDE